eukprot:2995556-Rhodomonas_salina.1
MLAMMAIEAVIPDHDASHAGSHRVLVDSVTTLHLSNDRSKMFNIKPYHTTLGCIVNGKTIIVKEKGDMLVRAKKISPNGNVTYPVVQVTDMLIAEEVSESLISLSKASKTGLKAFFTANKAGFTLPYGDVIQFQRDTSMDIALPVRPPVADNGVARSRPLTQEQVRKLNALYQKWHARCRHTSFRYMLSVAQTVQGMEELQAIPISFKQDPCPIYMLAKSLAQTLPSKSKRAKL